MKKLVAFLLLICVTFSVSAQEKYKYVIVPTHFPGIGSGLDPYGVSSSLQKILTEKSIKCNIQQNQLPEDYCETLTAHVEKVPNMFRSKVKVEFKDCRNQTIWSGEGTGMSKAFREGYAEAMAAALKDFETLPVNQSLQYEKPKRVVATTQPEVVVAEKEVEPVVEKAALAKPITQSTQRIYKPSNLFYNYNYFVDVIEKGNGNKELMILNGELLGYQNLEVIATLVPSGLENVYTVEWNNADKSLLNGVANLVDNELKISLKNASGKLVIQLQKY